MFNLACKWLLRTWWGILIAYAVLVTAAYLAIWAAIEPLSLPDTFQGAPWPINARWFYHVTLAIFAGAHLTLFIDLWLRRGVWRHGNRSKPGTLPVSVQSYGSREAVYSAAVDAIRTVERGPTALRTLFLGALHGHSGKRRLSRSSPDPTFSAFDCELLRCVKSSGPGMWRVRELYNVTTLDRLEEIVGWLQQTENEDGYEVRAFCEPSAIGHLAPLVVGGDHAFLSLEDDHFYRVAAGVQISNRAAVALVLRYCESLWTDSRAFILRTGFGVDNEQIRALRARLAQVQGNV